jgi:hypothetical protein
MKKFISAISLLVLFLIVALDANAARPPQNNCGDVPISLAFIPSSITAINSDNGNVYQDGVDGLSNTVIHFNSDCNGSHDATMLMPTTGKRVKRKVSFQFPAAIPGTNIDQPSPSFAPGNAFLTPVWMNIRNLTGLGFIPQDQHTVYYTRMIFEFKAPDSNTYRLVFDPDSAAECPAGAICNTNFGGPDPITRNSPVQTAWVKVTHTPPPNPSQPWSPTNADTWLVEGTLTSATDPSDPTIERSTLVGPVDSGLHFGQYSMPLQILITAMTKLPTP